MHGIAGFGTFGGIIEWGQEYHFKGCDCTFKGCSAHPHKNVLPLSSTALCMVIP